MHHNASTTGIRIPQALPNSLETHFYTEIVKANFCEGVRAEDGRKEEEGKMQRIILKNEMMVYQTIFF